MNNIDNDKESFLERILQRKWTYIVLTLVFFTFSFLCFKWGHSFHVFNKDYIIDHGLFGTFGDFFGGVLGTIFTLISVLLVVRTFKYQQMVSKNNQELQKAQQFNDLFFELIHLYQSEVKELNGELERVVDIQKNETKENNIINEKERIQYNDKDFFDEEKKKIQVTTKQRSQNDLIIKGYRKFYVNNRSKIAAYYRTLYRIFELIDKSNLILESQKKEYSKIIRAQLTESELFFLRYNAMTNYGQQFVEYLNKYHILKHLPAFELLEFKYLWGNLNISKRESINTIYFSICESIKVIFDNGQKQIQLAPIDEIKDGLYMTLNLSENKSEFYIELFISNHMVYLIFDKGSQGNEKMKQLLDCFINEIFMYSNFNQFNKQNEIETNSFFIKKESIVVIHSGIKNIKNNPLIIKYPHSCPSTK